LQALAGKLFFNPGSAGKKRFSLPRCCGMLEVLPRGVLVCGAIVWSNSARYCKVTARYGIAEFHAVG
jgi:hypothetical protein